MINTYRSGEALLLEIERTVVPDNAIAMWNIGQEGYILKGRNQVLVVDPYLTDSIEQENMGPKGLFVRDFPPPVEPSAFRGLTLSYVHTFTRITWMWRR
ncbi:hypothetical protein [Alicyclobacillus macrosporangiidus]|uniref:hypothetical protein n=1 Tax=Alicyclobacillus macrosporangiidus TaxID=392015 RepID=UPI000691CE2F|nr:hypothetical protein [Alicyclobacillus macrosporangiidus]